MTELSEVRIDRWLWAARFFKTRSLAKQAVDGGKVQLDGQRVKPAKVVRIGQTLEITRGSTRQIVVIQGLSQQRGSAPIAQGLYEETAASVEAREAARARRAMERAGLKIPSAKPSKKERRDRSKLKSLDGEWTN